ncbi:MAG: calcium-binding protein [Pseudomonadota bacterium]
MLQLEELLEALENLEIPDNFDFAALLAGLDLGTALEILEGIGIDPNAIIEVVGDDFEATDLLTELQSYENVGPLIDSVVDLLIGLELTASDLVAPALAIGVPKGVVNTVLGITGPDFPVSLLLEEKKVAGLLPDNIFIGTFGPDNIIGTNENDLILGLPGSDSIQALDGNDIVLAGLGDDTVEAGATAADGDDYVSGFLGEDSINGGAGNDTLLGGKDDDSLIGSAGKDIAKGGDDNDTILGGSNNDRLFGEDGDDIIEGESGRDRAKGQAGNDSVDGGSDGDLLAGGSGDDTVVGGSGDDEIFGNANSDEMIGGTGSDTISGNKGADSFIFQNGDLVAGDIDIITDFRFGVDAVSVDASDPNAGIIDISNNGTGTTVTYINGYQIIFDGVTVGAVTQLAEDGDLGVF